MRLAITGPQNTGKTTFIKDFLKAFPEYSSPSETYHDVVKKKKLKINRETTEENQKIIRDFLYEQTIKNKKENVIFDRCVLDNLVYSFYQYEIGRFDEKFIFETTAIMKSSLAHLDALVFIPSAVSIQLISDMVRDIDTQFVDAVNRIFIKIIIDVAASRKIKIFVITGDRESRINQIRKCIGN